MNKQIIMPLKEYETEVIETKRVSENIGYQNGFKQALAIIDQWTHNPMHISRLGGNLDLTSAVEKTISNINKKQAREAITTGKVNQ